MNWNRIWKIGVAVAIAIFFQLEITIAPAQARTQRPCSGFENPNIVLIFMDNFGWGELGVYGGGILRGAATPRIDKLAGEGMRLLNFNVEAQCTPSRAAIMTGRYAIRTGNSSIPLETPLYGLTQWEYTLAEMLSDAGYSTGMFGKWHLGQTEGRFPTDQGFDEWYGIPNSSDEAFWPDDPRYRPYSHPAAHPEYIMTGHKGEKPTKLKVYNLEERAAIDKTLTDKSMDFMERKVEANKPFFLFVPYTQTHMPVTPHPDFAGSTRNGDFADVLAQTDFYVGQLLDKVDELGIRDNTIFIFTSDNGPDPLAPYHGFSGPWRGSYFTGFEGSLRVPFIIRWPGKVPAGVVNNENVHEMDLFPTFARIVGGNVPQDRMIDGVDQLNFFLGEQVHSNREAEVIYVGNQVFGVKWRNFKMINKKIDSAWAKPTEDYNVQMFFDLHTDPKEEYPLDPNWIHLTWMRWPAGQVLLDHTASLEKEPPIPPGTPDPYIPTAGQSTPKH
ncbi:arylsulfatase [Moorena sp. SIO4G3]|uniref:arylsulfatase n=1 Tax=Moorena sp. SIO4G3 TaxID=2607821 RepID=UPI00142B996F|nr:arylsulfatase [Moorena sp. SIO4G3]NEO81798.1 arylsulfatase [Moorena sp. SIO4G3]